jgi:LmbE family N-acetylglucosaminyl deacetylase
MSPHFDDLAYSNGGLIIKKLIPMKFALVNIFTRSLWAPNLKNHCLDSTKISEIRLRENANFCRSVGIRSFSLGFADSSHRGYSEISETPSLISDDIMHRDNVSDKVYTMIAKFLRQASFDVVFAPLALGNHIDHYIVSRAIQNIKLSGVQKVFYEDLPYCASLEMSQIDQLVSERLHTACPILVDITKEIDRKIENVKIYGSQVCPHDIDAIRFHSKRLLREKLSFHERIWVQAPRLTS